LDNRRLFLAALLSLAVLLIWQWAFPPEPAPKQPLPVESLSRPETAEPPLVEVEESEPTEQYDLPPEEGSVPEIEAEREERLVLETESVRAEFTNRGAQLVSFVLKDEPDSSGGQVDLVRRRAEGPYPFALSSLAGESDALNEALFVSTRVATAEGNPGLLFEYSGPWGRAEKRFAIDVDGILEVDITVPGRRDWSVLLGPGIRNPTPAEQKNRFARKSAVYSLAGSVDRVDAARADSREEIPGGGLQWIGIQDTYFLVSWIVDQPVAQVTVQPVVEFPEEAGGRFRDLGPDYEPEGDDKDLPREVEVRVVSAEDRLIGKGYWGPKEYDRLAALPYGLEQTVALGAFSFLARPLLWGLRWIHDHVVGNYGWAIILMTMLIRVILFPLTHKSFVSMQKMQELNPKVQAVRQKYRGKLKDKQGRPRAEVQRKMNEEVMGLYKSEGVNPAGGCLPMLLQIPVLFAFYNLLTAAFELRHAPWLLWIKDLSAPDPYYVLPIVMGASQFIQQRLTPSAADPMQRRIFMLMPFFFTILFLGFPSGLVLYWLTNNLLGIAQQWAYKRFRHPAGGKG
jgi:YidC/Oxa1 family membrane protein insertase